VTDILATIVVSMIAASVFWNSRHGDFVFDDLLIWDSVKRRRNVKENRSPFAFWLWLRPRRELLNWTYGADVLAHDPVWSAEEPKHVHLDRLAWWHYRNMAYHAVTTASLYAVARYWTSPGPAALGACLLATHPLCCASVASISGRSSLMCGMFYAMTLVAFLAGWWWLVPVLGIAAYQSKEEAVTMPLALVAVWCAK